MSTFDTVRSWILNWVERELHVSKSEVSTDVNLLNYGMDSVNAIMLVGDLESNFDLRLPPTLVWDYPTVDGLASLVVAEEGKKARNKTASPSVKEGSKTGSLSRDEAEQLLQNIDQLSDEEVSELLARFAGES